jgi:hypothetical protein
MDADELRQRLRAGRAAVVQELVALAPHLEGLRAVQPE